MIGMFYQGISGKAYPYFIYLMFLVPSIFVASTTLSFDANFRTNIAFVLSGPVCLGIAALFCYDKKVSSKQLNTVLLFILLPVIVHVSYNMFYTPDIKEIITGTASNTKASGGFGANQVATVFGFGMFILAVRFFVKSPTLPLKILNISLFAVITFRALVTLSRGGVYAAIIALIAFLVIYYGYINRRKRNELIMLFGLFCFGVFAIWLYTSTQTSGMLDKRYANEDSLGREKTDVTTGRGGLFINEIEGFISSPFFGIGSSRAKDQRIEATGQGVISHNEISRTLAEHGFFGVIIIVILIFKPLYYRSQNRSNVYFYAFLCLWFATINHSSMRIAAPAFIYALALLNITYEKRPIHRKRLIK
jgi:Ca2+/Na+ antiporter